MLVNLTISKQDQEKIGKALNGVLAETYALYTITQGYHWNIEGGNFPQLHAAFQTQYEELAEAVDDIAERVRVMGLRAHGSIKEMADNSSLNAVEGMNEKPMLESLASGHEHVSKMCDETLKMCMDMGDEATADLMIERQRAHQKFAWMLRASLK